MTRWVGAVGLAMAAAVTAGMAQTPTPSRGVRVEVSFDMTNLGTPVASLRDLPPGDYFVQGFVNRDAGRTAQADGRAYRPGRSRTG